MSLFPVLAPLLLRSNPPLPQWGRGGASLYLRDPLVGLLGRPASEICREEEDVDRSRGQGLGQGPRAVTLSVGPIVRPAGGAGGVPHCWQRARNVRGGARLARAAQRGWHPLLTLINRTLTLLTRGRPPSASRKSERQRKTRARRERERGTQQDNAQQRGFPYAVTSARHDF